MLGAMPEANTGSEQTDTFPALKHPPSRGKC